MISKYDTSKRDLIFSLRYLKIQGRVSKKSKESTNSLNQITIIEQQHKSSLKNSKQQAFFLINPIAEKEESEYCNCWLHRDLRRPNT